MPHPMHPFRPAAGEGRFSQGRRRRATGPVARPPVALGSSPRGRVKRTSWKRTLQDLLAAHNDRHATKPKSVSFKTQSERACALFRCFRDLHTLGYKIRNPYCLGGRHVRALMEDWTAAQPRTRRWSLSPAMIQTELSHLRTFTGWIGKPGLVRPAESYVADRARVARRSFATTDRSWTAHAVDAERLIEAIADHDAWVGAQLRLARAFGLRVKETLMIQPRLAECAAGDAMNPSGFSGPHLEVDRGTKGGRARRVPIDTPGKRAALEAAKALVRSESQFLANPTRSLVQNLKRLRNVMTKFGVTHRVLGVTPHGLRHEYAGDRYEALAGVAAPVRGGTATDPATDTRARLSVAKELGHSRTQIVAAYCGNPRAGPAPRSGASRGGTGEGSG